MQFKLKENVKIASSTLPVKSAADANGTTVDRLAYEGPVTFIAAVGAPGDTLSGSVKIEFEVEHSDDGSSWADAADTDLEAAVTGSNPATFAVVDANAEASQVYQGRYIGAKRYVRCVTNITGTHTTGTPIAVLSVLEGPRHAPAT